MIIRRSKPPSLEPDPVWTPPPKTNVFIGPSGAKNCYRRSAYEYMGVEPSNEVSTAAANLGTMLHAGYSARISSMFDPKDREADVAVWTEGMPRSGEADDVDWTNRTVTDLKSVGSKNWDWLLRNGGSDSWWDQIEIYALGLKQQVGGDWKIRVLAVNRDSGETATWERPADHERGGQLVARIAGRHADLLAARASVDAGADQLAAVDGFPREYPGPGSKGKKSLCDFCPFMDKCYPDVPEGDVRTRQSATVEGDSEAIQHYAAEYLDAQQVESKARRRRTDARAFLEGVSGQYGRFVVSWTGGRPTSLVDCEAAVLTLEKFGVSVPMKDGTTPRTIRVSESNLKGSSSK